MTPFQFEPLRRFGLAALVAFGLNGCATPLQHLQAPDAQQAQVGVSVLPLSGQVVFPTRRVQALPAEYTQAATVSVIRASDNVTVAAAVSSDSGNFTLTFPASFAPMAGEAYYLEAVKGLSSNTPGFEAARVRTMVTYQDGWLSLSNGSVGGAVVVDSGTTAIAIGAALRAGTVSFTDLIGKYSAGSGAYTPIANLTAGDFATLKGLVERSVLDSEDPVGHIGVGSDGAFVHQANFATMLHGLDKPYISAGETLTLDGNFGAGALVNFPGGQTVPLSSVGINRGSVVIPSGTLPGELTVTSRRTTSAVGHRFNPLTFTPNLGNFSQRDEQTSAVKPATDLAVARWLHTSVVIGKYLYVMGGAYGSSINSVERAVINTDGSLGRFINVTPATSFARRSSHTSMVIGNYLYVIGGGGISGFLNSIERAVINVDGSLGNFSNVTPAVSFTSRSGHTSVVIGNYLYVMGGQGNFGQLDSIERAVINVDGSLGNFSNVTPAVSFMSRQAHTSVAIGNYLFIMGGHDSSGPLNTIERAAIKADGGLGNFSNVTPANSFTARHIHTSAVIGNYLYVMGGYGSSGTLNNIERAAINADGSLGNFSNVTPANSFAARSGHTSAVIGNYLYVIGGYGISSYLNSVERSHINADGNLGNFSNVTPTTSFVARVGHTSAVIDNYLYVMGGLGDVYLNSIERSSIHADGSLGSFTNVTPATSFTARYLHTSAVIDNYLYIMGGHSSGNDLNSIERAVINADGTLGSFSNVTPATTFAARNNFTSAVVGNRLYVIGGNSASGKFNSVERTVINADGSLGNFSNVTPANSFVARFGHTSAVIGNYLYVIGGHSGASYLNSIERAVINADGSLGDFSAVTPATSFMARNGHKSAVIGNYLYVMGGSGGSGGGARLNSIERAVINADGSLGDFSAVTPATSFMARNGHTSAVIGNYLYVMGGADSSGPLNSIERTGFN